VRTFVGGETTGPSPVEVTEHTPMVDRHEVPSAIRNAGDHDRILPTALGYPRVGGASGRPEDLPDDLYAGRSDDSEATRASLRSLGIGPHIAERGEAHGRGSGRSFG
jgi:hypothetical protein